MVRSSLDDETRTLLVKVRGDLLSTNADERACSIGDILRNEDKSRWDNFVLDLRSANMVDSVGLNVIVGIIKEVRKVKAPITVSISSPAVNRLFLFSRLDTVVNIDYKERRSKR